MFCKVIWRGNPQQLTIIEKDDRSVVLQVTPVVVRYWFGVTVGVIHSNDDQFGFWYSSNITDVLSAWRVAQLIPRAKQLREAHGYDQTLCSLVIQLNGDDNMERRKQLAEDFGVETEEIGRLLTISRKSDPTQDELEKIIELMFDDMNKPYTNHLTNIERVVESGVVELSIRSSELIEKARTIRTQLREQAEADEKEIEQAISPEKSFSRLVADLGIPNLLDVPPDDFGPSHIPFEKLDSVVKEVSIGRCSYRKGFELVVTEKNPSDPSAHYSSMTTDGSVGIFGSNYGKSGHPFFAVGDVQLVLHRARYERGGDFIVSVSVRAMPTTLEIEAEQDAEEMTLNELRVLVGKVLRLPGPLPLFYRNAPEPPEVVGPQPASLWSWSTISFNFSDVSAIDLLSPSIFTTRSFLIGTNSVRDNSPDKRISSKLSSLDLSCLSACFCCPRISSSVSASSSRISSRTCSSGS